MWSLLELRIGARMRRRLHGSVGDAQQVRRFLGRQAVDGGGQEDGLQLGSR